MANSSESSQQELSNEYQHDRVKMIFNNLCVFVLWTKVASALEGLRLKRFSTSSPVPLPMKRYGILTGPVHDTL